MFNTVTINDILDAFTTPRCDYARDYEFSSSVKESIKETDDEIILSIELPGIAKDSIAVNIERDILKVSATKKKPEETGNLRDTRRYGEFNKNYNIKCVVDTTGIEATYNDGVLVVTIPKAEESKPRKIDIK